MSGERREGRGVLAVVPARAGSKGIKDKNLRQLGGVPLIVHTLRYAALCPELTRTVVSTDSPAIAATAREHGGDVPFLRPAELAADDTPTWAVLRHAMAELDPDGEVFDTVVLLEPTSPVRRPADLHDALARLEQEPAADGIVGVAEPDFNPIWQAVVERGGFLAPLVETRAAYTRRQDLPTVYAITGSLYVWRAAFVRAEETTWQRGRLLLHVLPKGSLASIDEPYELERLEALVAAGLVRLPSAAEAW